MININNRKLCEYCFEETDREPCPQCGFSRAEYEKDPAVLEVGSVLEHRYVIGGVIGKGGFGITYLAYDMKLGRKVAIKEYYPYGLAVRNIGSTLVSATTAESVEVFKGGADKFYNEACLMAKFNDNPNIVSVHDFFYENDTVYFTMGFLRGQTLKAYLREHGVLSPGQAVCVAGDITNALIAAHHLNVLHRDISPDNIMVCSDGTVKLLDFGAARQLLTEGSQSLSVILKQGFAPLEQYQKKGKQGPWTDIYALGATLYYALTLDLLDDPMSRLEDDSEYSSNIHGIEEPLWEVIRKATMLKASERYQGIHELKAALDSLPIMPVRLTVPEEAANEMKFEAATRTGEVSHHVSSAPEPFPRQGGDATMSMQENVGTVGETMALQETAGTVGETMALQETVGTVGVTMALQEDAVATGMTMSLPEAEPEPQLEPEAAPEPEAQPEPQPVLAGKLKRGVIIAGICAVVLVGAAGAFFLSNTTQEESQEVSSTAPTEETEADSMFDAAYTFNMDGEDSGVVAVGRDGDDAGFTTGGAMNLPTEAQAEKIEAALKYEQGHNGKALYLDRSKSYGAQLKDVNLGAGDMTISFWIRVSEGMGSFSSMFFVENDLSEKNQNWFSITKGADNWSDTGAPCIWSHAFVNDKEEGFPWYNKNSVDEEGNFIWEAGDAVADQEWHHIVLAIKTEGEDSVCGFGEQGADNYYEGYHGYTYVDGKLWGNGAISKRAISDKNQYFLGINAWDAPMNAFYDDVMLWKGKALTDQQVEELYNKQK